ncbi:MAG: hypothetical protein ACYC6M_05030 [Terriglobales bacterium]
MQDLRIYQPPSKPPSLWLILGGVAVVGFAFWLGTTAGPDEDGPWDEEED